MNSDTSRVKPEPELPQVAVKEESLDAFPVVQSCSPTRLSTFSVAVADNMDPIIKGVSLLDMDVLRCQSCDTRSFVSKGGVLPGAVWLCTPKCVVEDKTDLTIVLDKGQKKAVDRFVFKHLKQNILVHLKPRGYKYKILKMEVENVSREQPGTAASAAQRYMNIVPAMPDRPISSIPDCS